MQRVPRLDGQLVQAGVAVGQLDAGAGDEHVDPAHRLGCAVERRFDLRLDGAIRSIVVGGAAAGAELVGRLLQSLVRAVDEGDLGALVGEALGAGAADPAGGSGDDGAFAGEATGEVGHRRRHPSTVRRGATASKACAGPTLITVLKSGTVSRAVHRPSPTSPEASSTMPARSNWATTSAAVAGDSGATAIPISPSP